MKPRDPLVMAGLEVFADAAQAERTPPRSFLLVKYGKTAYTRGTERGEYEFAEADADKMLAEFAERNRDGVIDYEHQTLSGDKAPAAGWIERLEKTADGVVAHVRYWTDEATKLLKGGEYRYLSPVLTMSRRRPMALHSVALTNHPATHGIPALVASDDEPDNDPANQEEQDTMESLKRIAELLGVAVVALADGKGPDETATMAAIEEKLKDLLTGQAAVGEFLKLHDAKDLDTVTGKIKGMVPAADLTALNDRLAGIEADKAVAKAFADRKLVEAQRAWALAYARKDLQAFADFVTAAPVVAPGPAAAAGVVANAPSQPVALTDDELKVYRNLGLSDDAIEQIRKDRQGA
jgi:phage I-like protein